MLINTAPVRDREIVLGKFIAALHLLTGVTVMTAYIPLLIFVNGRVSVGHILVGYLGIVLLGAASSAIGLFASAFARTQIVAAISRGAHLGRHAPPLDGRQGRRSAGERFPSRRWRSITSGSEAS